MASTNEEADTDIVPQKRTKIEREPNKDAVMMDYRTIENEKGQDDKSEDEEIDIPPSDQIQQNSEGNKTWMLVSPNEISVDIAEEIIDVREGE